MVFLMAFTCQDVNTNQPQKAPLSYSQKNNLPYVFSLNVNVSFITKQAYSGLVWKLHPLHSRNRIRAPSARRWRSACAPEPANILQIKGLCGTFLCCPSHQNRKEIVIPFHSIFMSFHSDAGEKACSSFSLLVVSWETEMEVYSKEQEPLRHFYG